MRYALLEPLRGIAALWVFCYHYRFSDALQQWAPGLHTLFRVGDLGVPMFFVLSGYCITASARSAIRHDEPTRGFLYRRVRRIYPPYWFSILVVASLPFIIQLISGLKTGRYDPPTAANPSYGFLDYSVSEWIGLVTLTRVFADFPDATDLQVKFTSINAVYWTLAIEVQFYLVVAAALAWRRFFYPILGVVTLFSIPAYATTILWPTGLCLPYWPMFALGVGVYWLFEQGLAPSRWSSSLARGAARLATLGLIVGFIVAVLNGMPTSYLGFAAFFALILLLAESWDRLFVTYGMESRQRIVRGLVAVAMAFGAMSYSLYLLHGKLQYLTMQVFRQVFPANSIAFDVASIGVTCAMAYVFYWVCERPFMSTRQKAIVTPPAVQTLPLVSSTPNG